MRIVLLWHMHQPDYRVDGRFARPWVYLHALAGYTEMAARLESCGSMRAVVNFTPVLLDQLDDYDRRMHRAREHGQQVGDALLDALVAMPEPGPGRADLVLTCLSASDSPRAKRHPHYRELAEAAARHVPATLPDELFGDLLTWFHLTWIGPSIRAADPRARQLLERARGFDRADRRALFDLVADTVAVVLPRWRALAGQHRVELATSPFYHPLCPLLLDFKSALDRAPATALPATPYPDGATRLRWQLAEGIDRFEALMGHRPGGCWPPEAALSEAVLLELGRCGFEWTASTQSVLNGTLAYHGIAASVPYRLFRNPRASVFCAFRDDGLSDRIGFEYQHWQPADAVRDLVRHLESMAENPEHDLVLIALDGENPWEYYPDDGSGFLQGLYEALSAHETLRPATMRDCLRDLAGTATQLPALRAGSWVHGELLTWVGHPEKNRAWEMLVEAKRACDELGHAGGTIDHRLGACEGSDWFWWPGINNPAPAVAQFDELFRAHLSALYRALDLPPPNSLSEPFASGVSRDVEAGGTMQRGS